MTQTRQRSLHTILLQIQSNEACSKIFASIHTISASFENSRIFEFYSKDRYLQVENRSDYFESVEKCSDLIVFECSQDAVFKMRRLEFLFLEFCYFQVLLKTDLPVFV